MKPSTRLGPRRWRWRCRAAARTRDIRSSVSAGGDCSRLSNVAVITPHRPALHDDRRADTLERRPSRAGELRQGALGFVVVLHAGGAPGAPHRCRGAARPRCCMREPTGVRKPRPGPRGRARGSRRRPRSGSAPPDHAFSAAPPSHPRRRRRSRPAGAPSSDQRRHAPQRRLFLRQALHLSRASALAMAVATSSVKLTSRASVPAASGRSLCECTARAPHRRPSTEIGLPTDGIGSRARGSMPPSVPEFRSTGRRGAGLPPRPPLSPGRPPGSASCSGAAGARLPRPRRRPG